MIDSGFREDGDYLVVGAQGIVSIVELKGLTKETLPDTSMLRQLILSEPDYRPNDEAMIKAKLYAKLLYHELK